MSIKKCHFYKMRIPRVITCEILLISLKNLFFFWCQCFPPLGSKPVLTCCKSIYFCLPSGAMEAIAHRNRLFSHHQYLHFVRGFSMAMLNNQMVGPKKPYKSKGPRSHDMWTSFYNPSIPETHFGHFIS